MRSRIRHRSPVRCACVIVAGEGVEEGVGLCLVHGVPQNTGANMLNVTFRASITRPPCFAGCIIPHFAEFVKSGGMDLRGGEQAHSTPVKGAELHLR